MSGKTYTELPVTTLANGYRLALPLHTVVGAQPGPRLGMTALIHGDETLPNVILQRVLEQLAPAKLHGTLSLLPVANPLAYESLTRHTPLDMTNLNRIFPGSRGGWFTEQIAHVIATQFLTQIDFLLDWHSGGAFPTVDYVFLSHQRPDISKVFGFPILYDTPGFEGSISNFAQSKGIPSLVIEIGGGSLLDAEYIERGLYGLWNVMKLLGMLEGRPEPPPPDQIIIKELLTIRPRFGGMLYPEAGVDQIGKILPRGALLGRTVSPYTFQELERFTAPFDKSLMVLLRGTITRVNPGDYAYMVGNAGE